MSKAMTTEQVTKDLSAKFLDSVHEAVQKADTEARERSDKSSVGILIDRIEFLDKRIGIVEQKLYEEATRPVPLPVSEAPEGFDKVLFSPIEEGGQCEGQPNPSGSVKRIDVLESKMANIQTINLPNLNNRITVLQYAKKSERERLDIIESRLEAHETWINSNGSRLDALEIQVQGNSNTIIKNTAWLGELEKYLIRINGLESMIHRLEERIKSLGSSNPLLNDIGNLDKRLDVLESNIEASTNLECSFAKRLDGFAKRLNTKESNQPPVNVKDAEIGRLNTKIHELLSRQDRDRAMIDRLESRIELLDKK